MPTRDPEQQDLIRRLQRSGQVTVKVAEHGLVVSAWSPEGKDVNLVCPLIGALKGVVEIISVRSGLRDEGLVWLAQVETLEKLNIDGCRGVTGSGMRVLSKLPRLKKLICTPQTDPQLAIDAIARIGSLEDLVIGGELPNCDLSPLGSLRQLRRIDVTGGCEGRGLEALAQCPQLAELDFERTGLTDGQLAELIRLPLRSVSLGNTRLTERGTVLLAGCPALQLVTFRGLPITAATVRALRPLPELETLMLWDMTVDQAAEEALCEMQQVRHLYLYDPMCPDDRRVRLRDALKDCRIDWRDGWGRDDECSCEDPDADE